MPRRDLTWTTAFCASLVVHGVLVGGAAEWYVRDTSIHLPGLPRDMIVIARDDPEHEPDRRNDLGERDARGYAVNASVGRETLRAREADQDQALLSRDPAGPGRIGDEPSDSLIPPGDGSRAGDAGDGTARAVMPRVVAILPVPTDDSRPIGIGPREEDLTMPATHPARLLVAAAVAPPVPPSVQPKAPAADPAAVAGGAPGAPRTAADPAPMSESESDAFARVGSIEFRGGKMDVRLGRRFKSVRPRLTLAAQYEQLGMISARTVLKVLTDEAGKVTKVEVLKSSGSPLLDQPTTVAMYQWWFEPPTDAAGKPKPDAIVFTIRWR